MNATIDEAVAEKLGRSPGCLRDVSVPNGDDREASGNKCRQIS